MLHFIEQLGKSKILKIPRYPRVEVTFEEDNVVTLKSTVFVHNDRGATIDIFLLPVIGTYIVTSSRDRNRFIEAHLRECLRISKYFVLSVEIRNVLPCIESITKGDPELLHKLHYMYP